MPKFKPQTLYSQTTVWIQGYHGKMCTMYNKNHMQHDPDMNRGIIKTNHTKRVM